MIVAGNTRVRRGFGNLGAGGFIPGTTVQERFGLTPMSQSVQQAIQKVAVQNPPVPSVVSPEKTDTSTAPTTTPPTSSTQPGKVAPKGFDWTWAAIGAGVLVGGVVLWKVL